MKESGQLVYSLINYNVTLTSQLCIYAEMHLKLLYAHISICHAAAASECATDCPAGHGRDRPAKLLQLEKEKETVV